MPMKTKNPGRSQLSTHITHFFDISRARISCLAERPALGKASVASETQRNAEKSPARVLITLTTHFFDISRARISCLAALDEAARAPFAKDSTNIYPPQSPTRMTNEWILKLAGAFHGLKTSRIRFCAFSYSVAEPCGRSFQVIMYCTQLNLLFRPGPSCGPRSQQGIRMQAYARRAILHHNASHFAPERSVDRVSFFLDTAEG